MLALLQAAATLKMLPRSGWLFAGIAYPESVADHSWGTALLTLQLAALINSDLVANGLNEPVDAGRAAQIAIVHDLAETVITDLPKRATVLLGKTEKHRAEEKALVTLAQSVPSWDLLSLWREYSEKSTPEGRLVSDADKLEMVHQALFYEHSGNRNLGEFWHGYQWFYQVSEEMFAALVKARRSGDETSAAT